jgi:ubiquinone/menaquinone biosynthesis C-methylase UbiE
METEGKRTDLFAIRSSEYDHTDYRINYIDEMAHTILEHMPLDNRMTLLDFGAGTGLLTELISSHVRKIIAIDISPSMIEKLLDKAPRFHCEIEVMHADLTREPPPPSLRELDGIISSMTLHHISDIPALLKLFHNILKPGAFIALCDIDPEDGTFHTIDTGVRHHGFDREMIAGWTSQAGFEEVAVRDAALIRKPQGEYQAFLLSAFKKKRSVQINPSSDRRLSIAGDISASFS